jgi:hypothetical protein
MTRLRARCAGGGRIHEATPGGHWKIMTILGAIRLRGVIAAMTIEEATDGDIFLAFVRQVLSPALKQGDVVVMGDGQSQFAQADRGAHQHPEGWRGIVVLAALFAGHEPLHGAI